MVSFQSNFFDFLGLFTQPQNTYREIITQIIGPSSRGALSALACRVVARDSNAKLASTRILLFMVLFLIDLLL